MTNTKDVKAFNFARLSAQDWTKEDYFSYVNFELTLLCHHPFLYTDLIKRILCIIEFDGSASKSVYFEYNTSKEMPVLNFDIYYSHFYSTFIDYLTILTRGDLNVDLPPLKKAFAITSLSLISFRKQKESELLVTDSYIHYDCQNNIPVPHIFIDHFEAQGIYDKLQSTDARNLAEVY